MYIEGHRQQPLLVGFWWALVRILICLSFFFYESSQSDKQVFWRQLIDVRFKQSETILSQMCEFFSSEMDSSFLGSKIQKITIRI